MNRIKNIKIKRINNDTLFSLFKDYVKKIILEDLESIYKKKISILDSSDPWTFEIKD